MPPVLAQNILADDSSFSFSHYKAIKVSDLINKRMIVFIALTIAAILTAASYIGEGQAKYIRDNWSEMRCNPVYMVMPAVINLETDVATNFFSCITKSFNDYAGLSMDGMNSQMSLVGDSLGSITTAMSDMRGMMGETRGGFMMVFQMVFGKIQNLMSTMQYLMIRIRTLMGRIVGVFASLIYAFYAGEQSAESAWNGPIGKVVRIL